MVYEKRKPFTDKDRFPFVENNDIIVQITDVGQISGRSERTLNPNLWVIKSILSLLLNCIMIDELHWWTLLYIQWIESTEIPAKFLNKTSFERIILFCVPNWFEDGICENAILRYCEKWYLRYYVYCMILLKRDKLFSQQLCLYWMYTNIIVNKYNIHRAVATHSTILLSWDDTTS